MSRPPWRILIADDDPTATLLFQAALSGGDYEIETTDNGDDALDLFRRDTFDAALLDVEMPGLDGIAVCEAIRQSHGHAFPVILITGRNDAEFLLKAHSLAADYMAKPLDWAALPGLLRDVLGAPGR